MCGHCVTVAPSLRLVAAARSGQMPGLADLELDAPTINDALLDSRDLLWAVRTLLPASITPDGVAHHDTTDRDAMTAAYAHLTLDDLVAASRWCRTTSEHSQVSRVLMRLFGPKPPGAVHAGRAPERQALWMAHDAAERDRRRLVALERTDEERAATAAAVAEEKSSRDHTYRSRSHDSAVTRAAQRRDRGEWLTPHERDLLGIPR